METDINTLATGVLHHVDMRVLSPAYSLAILTILRLHARNSRFRRWVEGVPPSRVHKMLNIMVRECAWRKDGWLLEYIRCRPLDHHNM